MLRLTPKQVANAIGVSEASLKRWCDKGIFASVRTAGGHRRLALDGVIQYLRRTGHPLVRPEILGLPATCGTGKTVAARARLQIQEALEAGDEEQFRRVAIDLYLAGNALHHIFDETLAPVFHTIGDRWAHQEIEVYRERRAGEMCKRLLHEFRAMLRPPAPNAPFALGGTLETDPYFIPSDMVELTLREMGWRAEAYGVGLPSETLQVAIRELRPRLVWVAVGWFPDAEGFLQRYMPLYEAAVANNAAVVVGGRFLSDAVRPRMRYSAHCDKLVHLVSFARTLEPEMQPDVRVPADASEQTSGAGTVHPTA